MRTTSKYLAGLLSASVAAVWLVLGPASCYALEIGADVSAVLQVPDDTDGHAFVLSVPSAEGWAAATGQTFRVGFDLSERNQIEVSPSFSTASADYNGRSDTVTQMYLGLGYLRGRPGSSSAAPFLHVGGATTLLRILEQSFSQYGVFAGGGLRWRPGKVLGFRTEVLATRWFEGSSTGRWDVGLRAGVSAFTN